MKKFKIAAEVRDLCINPLKTILLIETIDSEDSDKAQKLFKFQLLIEDILVDKIVSIEEISQEVA